MSFAALGLLLASASTFIQVPQDGFSPLVDGQLESARAARTLEAALRATALSSGLRSDKDGARYILRGKVWSSGETEGGKGASHVQWTLTGRDGSPVGVWSAIAPSYREIISTLPGSGLDQPDGLSGEIWKICKWAAKLNQASKNQNLQLDLFDSLTGESVAATSIRSDVSRDLRISYLGPEVGSLCLFVFQGKEIVATEVLELKGKRRAVFRSRWNPAFGQTILAVHTKEHLAISSLSTERVSRNYAFGIIGTVHNEAPLSVWDSLNETYSVLGWRIL